MPVDAIEARERDRRLDQGLFATKHLLLRDQPRASAGLDRDRHLEPVAQARRLVVADVEVMDHEGDAVFLLERRELEAQRAQPLGAAALQVLEVVRVVDDTRRVGVLVVDTNGKPERRLGARRALGRRAHWTTLRANALRGSSRLGRPGALTGLPFALTRSGVVRA